MFIGLPHTALCLHYHYKSCVRKFFFVAYNAIFLFSFEFYSFILIRSIPFVKVPYDRLNLFFGTDSGDIHLLSFHMANKNLFETPFKKSDSCWKILFSVSLYRVLLEFCIFILTHGFFF